MNKNWSEYRGVSGIYAITHIESGKLYIGSAVDIGKRWDNHFSDLRMNKHHSPRLQNAWNKYGGEAFSFTIIEFVNDKNDLLLIEQKWIDYYGASDHKKGYNIYPFAGSPLGTVRSEETKIKMSLSQTGRVQSEETKIKISLARSGVPLSLEHIVNHAESCAKDWIVIDPYGNEFLIHNLNKFCKEHGLKQGNMSMVAQGKQKHCKGWKCRRA